MHNNNNDINNNFINNINNINNNNNNIIMQNNFIKDNNNNNIDNNNKNIIIHNNNINNDFNNRNMIDLNNNNQINNNIQNEPIKNNFLNGIGPKKIKKKIILKKKQININKENNLNQTKYTFLMQNNAQQNKPPKIGLKNLGKSSYVNSILQILGNIGTFANYFLNPEKISFFDEVREMMPLSFAIKELYANLYPKEKTNISVYEPLQIFQCLYAINNNYTANKENNIIFVLNNILNYLHRELNSSNFIEENYNYDKYNRKDCINKGIQFFTKSNISIVFNTLNWFRLKERRCIKCNISDFVFETNNMFKLDILSCYNNNILNNINKSISIIDCLKLQTSKKNENLFCNKCGGYESMEVSYKIFSSPNIFIFLLDRGIDFSENNILLKIPFEVENIINLGDFIENKVVPFTYKLIEIASISLIDKKYVSWCRSPINNRWYFFNDEKVEYIKLEKVLELNKSKAYIPCILVYKDIKIS